MNATKTSVIKAQKLGQYTLSEERIGSDTVTWVHKADKLIRGYWDQCPVTRRGHAPDLVQGLADGTLSETYQDVYGPASEWSQYDELPEERSLFTV